jgi:hypothetical protein
MLTPITPEIIEEVKNRLVKTYNPLEIYLYGPHAYGPTDPECDLDLAIVVDDTEVLPEHREAGGYRALFDLGVPSEIIVYTKQEFKEESEDTGYLGYNIKHRGKRIYAKA